MTLQILRAILGSSAQPQKSDLNMGALRRQMIDAESADRTRRSLARNRKGIKRTTTRTTGNAVSRCYRTKALPRNRDVHFFGPESMGIHN